MEHIRFEEQVLQTDIYMHSCAEMVDKLQDKLLEVVQPETRARIMESVEELAAKIKKAAQVQNIAECRLEVAASLYLIFKMIIPVM